MATFYRKQSADYQAEMLFDDSTTVIHEHLKHNQAAAMIIIQNVS